MKQYAVIGNPVEHSLSPAMYRRIFGDLNLNANHQAHPVKEHELSSVISDIRNGLYEGLNVTIPYKQKVIPFLDKLDEHAKNIGAVNCISREGGRLIGYNTDWIGFIYSLSSLNIDIQNRDFILLGAGGAARAILYGLSVENANKIWIINRTEEKARSLIKDMRKQFPKQKMTVATWENIPSKILKSSVIINGTSVGMSPQVHQNPMYKEYVFPTQIAVDIVYTPVWSQFRKLNHEIGGRSIGGLSMLMYQGLSALDIWFNESLSKKVNKTELYNYLEKQSNE